MLMELILDMETISNNSDVWPRLIESAIASIGGQLMRNLDGLLSSDVVGCGDILYFSDLSFSGGVVLRNSVLVV